MLAPAADRALVTRRDAWLVLGLILSILAVHGLLRNSSLEDFAQRLPWWVGSAGLAGALVCLLLAPGDDRAFIYFQF